MDQLARLAFDGLGYRWVPITCRGHGDAGREIEEQIAVDVLDRGTVAANRDDGVGARQTGRRMAVVERDVPAGQRPGQRGANVWSCSSGALSDLGHAVTNA